MEALGIDGKLMLAQVINFALFFYMFKRFLAKPFFAYFDKQKKDEKEKARILDDLVKREKKLDEERTAILTKARSEAKEIISAAKETSDKVRQETISKAEGEAQAIRAKAAQEAKDTGDRVLKEAEKHVITTGALIAKSALSDLIDQKEQEKIVNHILKNYDASKIYEN